MENTELIAAAIQEIEHPTWGVVEQFLEIHEIEYHDGKPVIAGIKTDETEKKATIYFNVKDEAFHFAVTLDIEPEMQVSAANTEEFCHVYFTAWSDTLQLPDLAALTHLTPTDSSDIGDKTGFRDDIATVSTIEFKPNAGPGATNEKLKQLLTFLEQDVDGIKQLVAEADGSVQVHTVFHNGNTMLGGIYLDKEDIQRLAAFNLEIDFDLYAEGNKFK
ncbi:MAG: DUF4279 domain-containing protein [Bacteroidota bacterium]|nr:DUF4279 domain-containing protein [Bacteroidota bacterium]